MDFDLANPAAQVAVERTCALIMLASEKLAVRKSECFIHDFKVFLKDTCRSCKFPMDGPMIHGLLARFLSLRKYEKKWAGSIGFSEDGKTVRWVKMGFFTDLPVTMPAKEAHIWAQRWDDFIDERRRDYATSAIGEMWHTCSLWVRADFETRLIESTILSAVSSVFFAFFAVAAFLWDIVLAAYLVLSIVFVILCLGGFMFAILNWSFGAVEAVALIVFVGLSVDYSLHITESYNQATGESRYLRVQDSLRRTGGALVGASMTSVLACPPILFCTVRLFSQFGMIIISNMVLSLIFSVGFLSALLAIAGPMGGNRRWGDAVKCSSSSSSKKAPPQVSERETANMSSCRETAVADSVESPTPPTSKAPVDPNLTRFGKSSSTEPDDPIVLVDEPELLQ